MLKLSQHFNVYLFYKFKTFNTVQTLFIKKRSMVGFK